MIQHVTGHTVQWADGLRVVRLTEERGNIWLEIVWQGKPVEVRIGRRALRAARVKRDPIPVEEMR